MSKKLQKNKIYNLDCFDFISRLEDESVDLFVLDPPYNMKKGDWDDFKSEKEFFEFTFNWIDKAVPKLKKNGSIYIFNTPYNCAFILKHLVEKKLNFQNWITWDKRDGMGGARRKFSSGQETVLFFTKGKDHTFNYNDVRIPYESTERIKHARKKGILKNGKRWFPNPKGKLCGEVWHITSERHKNKINGKVKEMGHATPKPLDMIERIITASSNEGDLVVDFFVVTGTTALASKKLKRNFICSDIDKKYVNLSKTRLDNHG